MKGLKVKMTATKYNGLPSLDRRGLTLVELMVSMAIFAVVMGVGFSVMVGARDSYQATRQRVHYQQSMRAVLSMITREVRSTGCDPAGAGFDKIGSAGLTTIQCNMDLNGDGDAMDFSPDENITYVYDPGTGDLTRSNGVLPMVVLHGLTSLTFTYFDNTGAVLGAVPLNALDRNTVRYVEVMMSGLTDNGETVSYTTRIALRNG